MIVTCGDEVRVPHGGKEYLFEEQHLFGYVYEVPDDLGQAAIATGKVSQLKDRKGKPVEAKDYKGILEIPSGTPII